MASNNTTIPHFVVFPFMASGHMIPLIDAARMLARRGVKITIITTAANAARFETAVARDKKSGLLIETIFHPPLPGIPPEQQHYEANRTLPELVRFLSAANVSGDTVEKLFQELSPRPNCIISDLLLPYTAKIAAKYNIPRVTFSVMSCLALYCIFQARSCGLFANQTIEAMDIVLPGLPDGLQAKKKHVPFGHTPKGTPHYDTMEAFFSSYGVIVNTFEGFESPFLEELKKIRGGKVWSIGPVSLALNEDSDKADRGSKSSIDGEECLNWLNSQGPSSVLYVCLGSLCTVPTETLIELGLGLEASNRPFIWVISTGEWFQDLLKWTTESGFEERIKGRGLLIKGWAPQVLILSHPSVGGFFTHCGWNSVLESLSNGLPMICWPLFGDHFLDQKLVVEISKIGVSLGVEDMTGWGITPGPDKLPKKENIKKAIEELFEGKESKQMRERAREMQKLADKAVEKEGSSYENLTLFIQDIMQMQQNS